MGIQRKTWTFALLFLAATASARDDSTDDDTSGGPGWKISQLKFADDGTHTEDTLAAIPSEIGKCTYEDNSQEQLKVLSRFAQIHKLRRGEIRVEVYSAKYPEKNLPVPTVAVEKDHVIVRYVMVAKKSGDKTCAGPDAGAVEKLILAQAHAEIKTSIGELRLGPGDQPARLDSEASAGGKVKQLDDRLDGGDGDGHHGLSAKPAISEKK